jgi:hypothetical protein
MIEDTSTLLSICGSPPSGTHAVEDALNASMSSDDDTNTVFAFAMSHAAPATCAAPTTMLMSVE